VVAVYLLTFTLPFCSIITTHDAMHSVDCSTARCASVTHGYSVEVAKLMVPDCPGYLEEMPLN